MSDWVVVGKLLGPYGIKGWIKVYSHTHPMENIGSYNPLWVNRAGDWQPIKLLQVKLHGKGVIAQIEGCNDREQVPQFSGLELAIKREQLPELANDEFYWSQLIGLKVVNKANECLGAIDHLLETGANDVLVVVPCDGSVDQTERLIPYVWEQVVLGVDLQQKQVTVDWASDF